MQDVSPAELLSTFTYRVPEGATVPAGTPLVEVTPRITLGGRKFVAGPYIYDTDVVAGNRYELWTQRPVLPTKPGTRIFAVSLSIPGGDHFAEGVLADDGRWLLMRDDRRGCWVRPDEIGTFELTPPSNSVDDAFESNIEFEEPAPKPSDSNPGPRQDEESYW